MGIAMTERGTPADTFRLCVLILAPLSDRFGLLTGSSEAPVVPDNSFTLEC